MDENYQGTEEEPEVPEDITEDITEEVEEPEEVEETQEDPDYNDFPDSILESDLKKYPFPYPLIECDSNCKKKIDEKASVANIKSPYVKKNEKIVEESIISTNKTYTLLYGWFILMIIVIYVLIIAVVSENSYHPLMNIIIFIFLVYMSYYLYNNLSL